MSKFSSIPIFGRSLTITSDRPKRTSASIIVSSLFLISTLIALFYSSINEINRTNIVPFLLGGFIVSDYFFGKKQLQKHGSNNDSSGYIGNLYLFNCVLMAIILVVTLSRLL